MRVKLSAFVHLRRDHRAWSARVWFYYIDQVEPQTGFDPLFDLTIVLMAFLGGYGSIAGAVLGALIIEPLHAVAQHPATARRRVPEPDPARRGLPHRRALRATRDHPDRRRVDHEAAHAGPPRGRSRATTMGTPAAAGSDSGQARRSVQEVPGDRPAAHRRDQEGLRRRPGAERRHDLRRGRHRGRPDRAERLGQDHAVQRHHRLRAAGRGPGVLRRQADHQRGAGQGVRRGHRPDLPAHADLPPAHRDREHADRGAGARRPRGRASGSARTRGRTTASTRMELLEFVGIERHANVLSGSLSYGQRKLLEIAYVLVADPRGHPARRARRRGEPDADQPHRRPHPRAQLAGQDVPDRRAQHGVRHGAVRHHHGARVRRGRRERAAGHHQDGQARARRLPGRGPGGGQPMDQPEQ